MTRSQNIISHRRAVLGNRRAPLTVEALRQAISYDAETGKFTWLLHSSAARPAGSLAGCINSLGYREVCLNQVRYLAHRLAWFYVTGQWPPDMIDHIASNRDNNAFSNLRLATRAENGWNAGGNIKNKTGFKGVSIYSKTKQFQAHIRAGGKRFGLGRFETPEEAARAYDEAARRLHGEFAYQNFAAQP